jgi:hypothetical protein
MKKNGFLFAILLGLFVFTYFFQEKKAQQHYQESLTKDHLFTEEISELKMGEHVFTKKEGKWWSGDILLSHNLMRQVEKKLRAIKKIKPIKAESASYFQHPLKLEVNRKPLQVGDLSLDKTGFYLSYDGSLMLAELEGENRELVSDEDELPSVKLDELKGLLSKPFSEFKENQLFRFYDKLPLQKITVKMEGHLDYELDLQKNLTFPPPIEGIEVHEKLQQKFLTVLTQMTIKEELPYSEKLKFKQLGSLTFANDKAHLEWDLWLRSKDSADAVLIDQAKKKAYLMIGGTLKAFFIQVQDYWDKKVIPPSKFENFTKLSMTFSQGPLSDQVQITNSNPLKFEATSHQVNIEKMDLLLGYLFNLGPHDQADRVSQLSSSERKQILSDDLLRVEVMNEEILFWPKAQEIILVNLTRGFKAHFMRTDKTMEFDFKDVLE